MVIHLLGFIEEEMAKSLKEIKQGRAINHRTLCRALGLRGPCSIPVCTGRKNNHQDTKPNTKKKTVLSERRSCRVFLQIFHCVMAAPTSSRRMRDFWMDAKRYRMSVPPGA
jgi:hypothetical protein